MSTGVFIWSLTASSNQTADSAVNWVEGQAPSSVNDSARSMMAKIAEWRDDKSGVLTTGGSSTAYTLTANQAFDTLANMNGKAIAFRPHVTNGAAPSLNVNGLGARSLNISPSVATPAGTLIAGTPYVAMYVNSAVEWLLFGMSDTVVNVLIGAMIDWTGPTVPSSNFIFPAGQAISRTTYANYFALVGTTFGAGDGSTTFTAPDMRGRVASGRDDMNGSAAYRITLGASGISGNSTGSVGGGQTVTLASGNIPQLSSGSVATTSVVGTIAGGAGVNITLDHTHSYSAPGGTTVLQGGAGSASLPPSASTTGSASVSLDHWHNFSVTLGTASPSGVIIMPPTIILNKLLRVL